MYCFIWDGKFFFSLSFFDKNLINLSGEKIEYRCTKLTSRFCKKGKKKKNEKSFPSFCSLKHSMRSKFQESYLMSTYNLAFVAGDLESLGVLKREDSKERVIETWALRVTENGTTSSPRDTSYKEKIFSPVISTFAKYFERDYPFDKLDIVAVPTGADGISAPGLITLRYGLTLLTYRTNLSFKLF